MSQGSTSGAEEYRRQTAESWELSASGWEAKRSQTRRTFSVLSRWIAQAAGLAPGMTVLELACGPGDMAAELAPHVVPGGRWLATDRAQNMVAAARRSADAAGLGEVIQPSVQDIEALTLDDSSVDAVVCRFGLMLVPDPAAVLRETRRVLRPGAGAAFVVWGAAAENPWATRPFAVLERAFDLPPDKPGSPGMFVLSEPGTLEDLARGAGFGGIRVEPVDVTARYASFEEYWDTQSALSGMASRLLRSAPAATAAQVEADVRAAVDEFRAADGSYALPGRALCLALTT